MKKRGQAATEFLTTYSWAILILLLVIAAIFSLNLFNPRVPNSCIGSDPITCEDIKFGAATRTISLRLTASGVSSVQDTTQVRELTLTIPSAANCNFIPLTLPNDSPQILTCNSWTPPQFSNSIKEGLKFRGTATVCYTLPNSVYAGGTPPCSSNQYKSTIIFSGTVEP